MAYSGISRWAALSVVLAALLASCGSSSSAPESDIDRMPPTDPVARFQELAKLKDLASFHVVYRLDTGYNVDEEEFAWLQDGERVRWDDLNTTDRPALAGVNSIDAGATGLSCVWATLEGNTTADVICGSGAYGWGLHFTDWALNNYFRYSQEIEFRDYRTVLGVDVECFGIDAYDLSGHICLSSEGVPLEIDSVLGADIGKTRRFSFTAIEIRPPPSDDELLTPIVPGIALGEERDFRGVPVEELALPSMPIVEEFFSEEGD